MRRILIVDDSPTTRAVIKIYLLGHGLEFIEANNGPDGLDLARKHRPEVVVLDLKLPGMDGFTFLRKLRRDMVLQKTPVVVLTGSKGDEVRQEAMRAGASYFMSKPINPGVLTTQILELLAGGS